MKRQKSFFNELPTCYLVATPIGNLEEMTPRALKILNEVDVIACEDTRMTKKLLSHFGIKAKTIVHQKFNEKASVPGVVKLLQSGQNVALVSDAGFPLISDPGYYLVKELVQFGFNVVPVNGSSALLSGLVASGLVTTPFYFQGFLPSQSKVQKGVLTRIRHYPATLVIYEAPHRIEKTLQQCLRYLGNRNACLARELTKLHEEFLRGTLQELLDVAAELKGEMVLIIEGEQAEKEPDIDLNAVRRAIEELIQQGMSTKDAIQAVALERGISKNEVYHIYHQPRS